MNIMSTVQITILLIINIHVAVCKRGKHKSMQNSSPAKSDTRKQT